VRLPWPWRRQQQVPTDRAQPTSRARPAARPPRGPTEAELLARLDTDGALRGGLDAATWQPIQDWLQLALRTLARRGPSQAEADAGYRALRDSALLLGDVLLGGTTVPDFAASLEGIEAYLTPLFPHEMERAFPALLEEAHRLQRAAAPTDVAAARLATVLRSAFAD
jgi:hypothetical protein